MKIDSDNMHVPIITVKTIGAPSITVSGTVVHLPIKKAEAIVYYLALEGTTNREELTSLMWGGKNELSAYNNFRNALYILRQYFPDGFVNANRRTVELNGISVDINDIDKLKDLSCPITKDLCDEPFKGFDIPESTEFGEWLIAAKIKIKTKIIDAIKNRITACYDAADNDKLLNALETLLDFDPFEEDYMLELADLYCNTGHLVKAISIFKQYKQRLNSEMGLTLSKRANEIFDNMLLSCTNSNLSNKNPENCFYGRKKEQEEILSRIDQEYNKPLIFLINGEPGVGKTSLLTNTLCLLKGENTILFSTLSYDTGMGYPYSSWNTLVAQAGDYAEKEQTSISGVNVELLAGIFPNFLSDKHITYNADLVRMSVNTPAVIGKSVCDLLVKVANGRRPIIAIEDIQWFDKQSIYMLDTFLAILSIPAVIFITTRPETYNYTIAKLKRLNDESKIELLNLTLRPFDEEETKAFCNIFFGNNKDKVSDFDEYVFRESEGLPLLVVELIKALQANKDIKKINMGGLGGVMLARFGEISEISLKFLRILSIFPNGTQGTTVLSVFSQPEIDHASAAAEELLQKQLIIEEKNIDGQTILNFRHEKVRECVYYSIPEFQRQEYHKKAAEILSGSYTPQIWNPILSSMISYHYTRAGLLKNVLQQYIREMVFNIALNHDLFPMIQDEVLLSCKLPFNDRTTTEHKMDEMSELLHKLNRSSSDDTDVFRMEATYLELRAGYMINWGEYKEGRIFIERALRLADQYQFNNIRIHCLQHIGHHFLQTDNWYSLLNTSREILHLAHDEEREKFVGTALRFIGVAFMIKGDFERALKVLNRSIEVFSALALMGKRYTLSELAALCYMGEIYQRLGHYNKAAEAFDTCIKTCEEKELFWGCSHFHAHMADLAFDMDDDDTMYKHIHRGAEIFESCQGGRCGSILYSIKAIADAKEGKFEDAMQSLRASELLSMPIKENSWISVHFKAKAYLAKMLENGQLPPYFGDILQKSSKEYAQEAADVYKKLFAFPEYDKLVKEYSI